MTGGMTMSKRNEKFRGRRTHGHGKKARRGHGKRGGVGNAGVWKHRKIAIMKADPLHFGRHGFKRPPETVKKPATINVGEIQDRLYALIEQGYAKKDGDTYVIDLESMGIEKLLGAGKVTSSIKVKVPEATERAIEKIKNVGGEVEINA